MKQINIPIPEKKDWERWYKIARFKLTGGFTCSKCGSKSDFNRVQFRSQVNGKELIFENNTSDICAECTRKELNQKADLVFTEHDCKCDWCGEHTDTMSFPRDNDLESQIIFGSNYWNGHHICQVCTNVGLDNRGPIISNRIKHENGHRYMMNSLGLWIKVE